MLRRRYRSRRVQLFVVGGVAALAAAAGAAYATIPDANGVIHACYAPSGGLRVIDSSASKGCKASESSLNWNVKGPAGPQGAIGPAGPQGPQGPPGNGGEAFATNSGFDPINFGSGTETTPVALSLPAGSYVLSGKVVVGERADTSEISCQLRHGGQSLDISTARVFGGAPFAAGSTATLPLVSSIILEEPATIAVVCSSTGDNSFAQFGHLYAVKLATLTQE